MHRTSSQLFTTTLWSLRRHFRKDISGSYGFPVHELWGMTERGGALWGRRSVFSGPIEYPTGPHHAGCQSLGALAHYGLESSCPQTSVIPQVPSGETGRFSEHLSLTGEHHSEPSSLVGETLSLVVLIFPVVMAKMSPPKNWGSIHSLAETRQKWGFSSLSLCLEPLGLRMGQGSVKPPHLWV